MTIDLSSLRKAIDALQRSVTAARSGKMTGLDKDLAEAVRSGVIQNFEVAYELCWKSMKRWIEVNVGKAVADGVTRRELFRLGLENRLIDDVDAWMVFHESRNETAHAYDSEVAGDVYAKAGEFLPLATAFLAAIEARNA